MHSMRSDWPFDHLQMFGYDCIVLDFPWRFELYSDEGDEKSASAHYQTMTVEEGMSLPVGELARGDCLLMMWATGPMVPQAIDLMTTWGFKYKSEMVWHKVTKNGKTRVGTGYRVRTMHEPVLLGTIGNPKHKPFPSYFRGVARQHSRKPIEFYDLVKKHMPNAYKADVFSRGGIDGFDCWGNQSQLFDAGDPVSTKRERSAPEAGSAEVMPLFPDAA